MYQLPDVYVNRNNMPALLTLPFLDVFRPQGLFTEGLTTLIARQILHGFLLMGQVVIQQALEGFEAQGTFLALV